jgi:hypothetical protein
MKVDQRLSSAHSPNRRQPVGATTGQLRPDRYSLTQRFKKPETTTGARGGGDGDGSMCGQIVVDISKLFTKAPIHQGILAWWERGFDNDARELLQGPSVVMMADLTAAKKKKRKKKRELLAG